MSLLCHFYAAINQSAKWSPGRTKSKSRPCYNLQVYKRGPRSSWETTRAISRNHEPFFHGALYGPPAGETSDQIRQCCRCTTCGIWLTHSLTRSRTDWFGKADKATSTRPVNSLKKGKGEGRWSCRLFKGGKCRLEWYIARNQDIAPTPCHPIYVHNEREQEGTWNVLKLENGENWRQMI